MSYPRYDQTGIRLRTLVCKKTLSLCEDVDLDRGIDQLTILYIRSLFSEDSLSCHEMKITFFVGPLFCLLFLMSKL